MSKENQIDPRKSFVPRFLPWVLGGVMLAVYWATLNHWVTLLNVSQVASVSGWTWQPQIFNPLTFLVTLPFRWLPTAQIPVALNVFSAFCAAAVLVVLARSVAILPHDRTDMERWRERGDFAFLTSWVAWIPPIAAVAFAGLQLAFWENATSFTGESFELLWVAIILWQLLEFRLDERDGRLLVAAFMYGAGIHENWAMVGFFPIFLMMLIWLRGLSFFNVNFLLRIAGCGLAGSLILLFLVAPLIARFSGTFAFGFWDSIKLILHMEWQVVHLLSRDDVRHNLALMSLTTLLPAFVLSIRWSSTFGDSSRMGASLVNYFIHLVNAILLVVLVWVTFDPPFSPRQMLPALGVNAPGLTLYYIVALSIGYFSGYFLLVFGKAPVPSRRNSRPEPTLPKAFLWLCPLIVASTLGSLTWLAGLLVYKNAPVIAAINDNSLLKFGQFTAKKLPPDHGILLCDADGHEQPIRAYLVQAALAREGLTRNYPVVDTHALSWPQYHSYLHQRFPAVWPAAPTNEVSEISPLRISLLLDQLSKSNNLCYLNPSFGYYFEQFYQEPHGLVYAMKPLPNDTLLPPPLDKNLIAENDSFWTEVLESSQKAIEKGMRPVDLTQQKGVIGWFMMHLHVPSEANPNALIAGAYYSLSLNTLGVQVQRADELAMAAKLFTSARDMNSNNVAANINLAFNKTLRAGSPDAVNLSHVTTDQFGKYRNWNDVMAANGPFDETSFCFENGCWLMQGRMIRQAAASFSRVRKLAPDNLATRLFLGQIYVLSHQPDRALEALHDPLTKPFRFALTEFNSTELNEVAAVAHFQKNEKAEGVALLESEMDRHPDNEALLLTAAQAFNMLGLRTNALNAVNRKLSRSPNDSNWVYGKGLISLQAGAYDEAVVALTRFLEMQTNHPAALFNRALAYMKSDHLDAARADFLKLQTTYTNSFQIAYGLGEIAWQQHQTNEAIRNYRLYLTNAPPNSAELKSVREHLTQLDAK